MSKQIPVKQLKEKGKPLQLKGLLINVPERQGVEEALRESEERFRQLADSMPQIVWTSQANGQSDYYNQQWYDYTGFQQGSLRDGWAKILHPNDRSHTKKAWQESIKSGKPYQVEYRFKDRRQPGTYRWFLGRALPVKRKNGKIIKWFGTCTDIDDVKHTLDRKQELEELNAALTAQREQLVSLNETKDEFISLASHQLRTPATGVKQYVGMLLEGYVGKISKEQKEMLFYAYESNERQLKIIDDLLRVAHVDAGKVHLSKSMCEIDQLIQSVIREQVSRFQERKQNLIFKKPPKLIMALVDAKLLRMVLENIIDNASKYTPEGKSVTIEARETDTRVIIRIKDQGIGIAKSDQKKLFQKFSRIDNPLSALVGGTGLGLYWAKKIIDLHEGKISLNSQVETGSTFTISIPKDDKLEVKE